MFSSKNTREDSTHGHHQMVNTEIRWIIFFAAFSYRWRSFIQSAKTRPGADCGSDHELLIATIRLKLKKVWKITTPFGCDINQIPKNYTVEMANRFKGLDLIDRVPEELWMEIFDIVLEEVIKTIPKKEMHIYSEAIFLRAISV